MEAGFQRGKHVVVFSLHCFFQRVDTSVWCTKKPGSSQQHWLFEVFSIRIQFRLRFAVRVTVSFVIWKIKLIIN
ncbi:MAG: hypothetical protein ACK55Z_03740 [bacterium]